MLLKWSARLRVRASCGEVSVIFVAFRKTRPLAFPGLRFPLFSIVRVISDCRFPAAITSSSVESPLSSFITPRSFTSTSKPTSFTDLSHYRLSSGLRTDSTEFVTGPFLLSISVFCFLFSSLLFFWFRAADEAAYPSAFERTKI